ncbi:hypothetical protein BC751_2316 [Cecembia calidifontis]|uniref:Uncharacterized protein n=1 Tax=Cecembia calidifontis TaxID=1187080 RepID=A0A4Q7P9A2_9BACT|nr:hypothetical protein BC751_2316 [Cecembia calidifontis]
MKINAAGFENAAAFNFMSKKQTKDFIFFK